LLYDDVSCSDLDLKRKSPYYSHSKRYQTEPAIQEKSVKIKDTYKIDRNNVEIPTVKAPVDNSNQNEHKYTNFFGNGVQRVRKLFKGGYVAPEEYIDEPDDFSVQSRDIE
jgi:hypothetical protein